MQSVFQPPCHAASSSPARGDTLISTAINFPSEFTDVRNLLCFLEESLFFLEFLEAVLLLDSGVILLILGEMTQEIVQMGESE